MGNQKVSVVCPPSFWPDQLDFEEGPLPCQASGARENMMMGNAKQQTIKQPLSSVIFELASDQRIENYTDRNAMLANLGL